MIRAGCLAALAVALGGCVRGESVYLDLAERAGAADHVRDYRFTLLGPLAGEPWRGPGLLREEASLLPRVAARRVGELSLELGEPAARELVLDMEPRPSLGAQTLKTWLNDTELAFVPLAPERRRYRFALPASAQRPGANRFGLSFAEAAAALPVIGRVAATLHAVALGPEGDAGLQDLVRPEAPPPFDVNALEGRRDLVQAGAGEIRWSFRLPREAELRTTPRLHPQARAGTPRVRFRIELETDDGARELWAREWVPELESELRLALPGRAGSLVTLSLELQGGAGTWGVWERPRLVSPEAPAPSLRQASSAADVAKGDALRQGLDGANVLLIVLDAARAQQFGCYGYPRPTTPELDRIAREGVVFERAYTPAVYTLAAMASVWTSRHPDEHGAGLEQGIKLGAWPSTLAERLSAHGVLTGAFVANVISGPVFGLARGFARAVEVFRGHGSGAESFRLELWPWLETNRARRFFAYAHYREPHFPYDAPPAFVARFGPDAPLPAAAKSDENFISSINWRGRSLSPEEQEHLVRLYDANLAYVDSEVGALRRRLEELGVWQRSLVIVTADHGEALYEHGPFVGHNEQLYEPSVRIPLIVRFPDGRGPSGVRLAGLVDTTDLAPTIAEAFGLPASESVGFGGRSLLAVIGGAPGKPAVVSRTVGERPRYMLRLDRFKYIVDTQRGGEQLFDLEADPQERVEVGASQPILLAACRQRLAAWLLTLRRARGQALDADALTPEQRENLRALGYIQ